MSTLLAPEPWPVRLEFARSARQLRVQWDDGTNHAIPFETLRVRSPSAEVQGHGANRPLPPVGKENVGVVAATPVGRYAVRLSFDDGHATGLFTWRYLRELGAEASTR